MKTMKCSKWFVTLFLALVLVLGSLPVLTPADEAENPYNPNWDITLFGYDFVLHLSEENYSFLLNGETEKYQMSLERLGWTPEEAQEILENNGVVMEIFPETARETTEYIIFVYNLGYYDAQGKTLEELDKDKEAAEAFRNSLMEHNFPPERLPVLSDEGTVKAGSVVWDVYNAPLENGDIYLTYVTVLNDTLLWMDLKYWDPELKDEMTAVMEDILGKATRVIHLTELQTMPAFDPDDLQIDSGIMDGILDNMMAGLQSEFGLADDEITARDSYDCIHKYPFYMTKEQLQNALEEEQLKIYQGTSPGVDELYVFRDLDDGSTWQMFYEFDEEEQLISVTMPLIAEGPAAAFSGPFSDAMNYYRKDLGDFRTEDPDALTRMQEDPEAFMESAVSEGSRVALYWEDAYVDGAGLYLYFMGINGKPSVFAVYYSPDYQ